MRNLFVHDLIFKDTQKEHVFYDFKICQTYLDKIKLKFLLRHNTYFFYIRWCCFKTNFVILISLDFITEKNIWSSYKAKPQTIAFIYLLNVRQGIETVVINVSRIVIFILQITSGKKNGKDP